LKIRQDKEQEIKLHEPHLVILRGLPGSGKSSVANKIKDALSQKIEIVDPDLIKKKDEEYINFVNHEILKEPDLEPKFLPYRYLLSKTIAFLENKKSVIWSQPFSDLEKLRYTIGKIKERTPDLKWQTFIVDILIDKDTAIQRINDRKRLGGHGPDDRYLDEIVSKFCPAKELGFPYLSLNSEKVTIETMAKKITKELFK